MSSPTQRSAASSSNTQVSQWLRNLWVGPANAGIHWRSLIGGLLALFLSSIVFTVSLVGLRFDMPVKLVGVVCVLLAFGFIFVGLRALLKFVRRLGLKRLFIFLLILYFIAVISVGAVVETDRKGVGHWLASAGIVARWTIGRAEDLAHGIIQAPDGISFAVTGRRRPIQVPGGINWIGNVPPTPIVVPAPSDNEINIPALPEPSSQTAQPASIPAGEWQIGNSVRVVNTESVALRVREAPGMDARFVARFPPNSILRILDGPKTVDGHVWWNVRGENGEGWCASDYLTLAEPP